MLALHSTRPFQDEKLEIYCREHGPIDLATCAL